MSDFQIAFRVSCRVIDDLETRLFNASWERMVMAAALQQYRWDDAHALSRSLNDGIAKAGGSQ